MSIDEEFGYNPVSIEFALDNHPITRFEIDDNQKVLIIAGKNGTGKTTLLYAINEISKLLSKEKIRPFENEAVARDFSEKGITHFKIRYQAGFGVGYLKDGLASSHGQKFITELDFNADYNFEDNHTFWFHLSYILEVSLDIDLDESSPSINWRNGIRFDSGIFAPSFPWHEGGGEVRWSKGGELMHPKSAPIIFDGDFDFQPSAAFVNRFKDEQISKYPWINSIEIRWDSPARFDPPGAVLVDIDRNDEKKAVEEIKGLLPELNDIHREYVSNPQKVKQFFQEYHYKNNLLPTLITENSPSIEFNFTQDYYEKTPDNRFKVNFNFGYPQFGDPIGVQVSGTFDNKQDRDKAVADSFADYAYNWFNAEEKIHNYREKWIMYNQIVKTVNSKKERALSPWGSPIPWDSINPNFPSWKSHSVGNPLQFIELNEQQDGIFLRLARALENPIFRLLYLSGGERAGTRQVRASDAIIFSVIDRFFPVEVVEQPYLTSGQRQILGILHTVVTAPSNSLILIDEPEISLHVDWQMNIIGTTITALENEGNFLIVTTHSPDICVNHLDNTQVLDTILDEELGENLT